MPKVTVIIPCYNQGHFLGEAVRSVREQTFSDIEIIVVNDGSTDSGTTRILKDFRYPNVRLIHTDNQGLAAARNNGIAEARGRYILPLDADDIIESSYIEKAVDLLDKNKELGIVYCRARLFGAVETEWMLPPYSLDTMLQDNVIFCSAMFRRSDWEAVGGYDTGMVYGWEDYEFWLSLIERGCSVYQIPEVLFAYRVAVDSMVRSKEKWQKVDMFKRVFQRHSELFSENIEVWIRTLLEAREPYYTSRLYIDCGNGISDENSVSRKVEPGSSIIVFNLNEFHNIKALRFDPVDAPAVVQIFKFVLEYEGGRTEEIVDYTDNALLKDGHDSYFEHNDPQYFFNLDTEDLQNIVSLTVQICFKALASDALSRLVDMQKQRLLELSEKEKQHGQCRVLKTFLLSVGRYPAERLRSYVKRQNRR